MKKFLSLILALALSLSLVACGGSDDKKDDAAQAEAPDLQAFFDKYMADMAAELGEENSPAMMEMEEVGLDAFYPGLKDVATKQMVAQAAMISAVAFEFVLVEVENPADVETVQNIFQTRITTQVEGGAFYPATVAAWEEAQVITNGNVVALIVAADVQAQAVEAFNALFA